MGLALTLGWPPSEIRALSEGELAAATEAAKWRSKFPPAIDIAAATFEQLNHLYILTWRLARAEGLIRKGAKEPQPVEVPRPYKPTAAKPKAANRKVYKPREFAEAMKRGDI